MGLLSFLNAAGNFDLRTARAFVIIIHMIYLNQKDILNAVTLDEMLDTIEESMRIYARKEFLMPQRMHVDEGQNVLLLMPCFTGDYFGTKLVSLFPENPKKDIPVLTGVMVLNDAQTGVPLALLDAPTLTAMRTAAAGSVSIRHLTAENTNSLGIVGAGVQGFYQGQLASAARKLTDIFVFDINRQQASTLAEKLAPLIGDVKIHLCASIEELLEKAQVVITATTSLEPVLPDDEGLLAGKHYVGIGSYKLEMREFPPALFKLLETVYIDTEDALEESGDIIIPLQEKWIDRSQIITLGQLLIDEKPYERVDGETTFFKSVGMALFDVCAAGLIYEKAIEKGLGQEIIS